MYGLVPYLYPCNYKKCIYLFASRLPTVTGVRWRGRGRKLGFFASVVVLCAFLCMRIIIIIIITFSFMARSRYRFRFRSPMRHWVLLISHKFNITRKDLHAKVSFKICFRPCPSFSGHAPTITHTHGNLQRFFRQQDTCRRTRTHIFHLDRVHLDPAPDHVVDLTMRSRCFERPCTCVGSRNGMTGIQECRPRYTIGKKERERGRKTYPRSLRDGVQQ